MEMNQIKIFIKFSVVKLIWKCWVEGFYLE